MASTPRTVEREEERRLNTRTLAIASIASATAAAVTSQLWIAGTWIAAAVTPVLVTLLSEALHRPTDRIARRISARSARAREAEPPAAPSSPPPASPAGPGESGRRPARADLSPAPSRTPRPRVALGVVAATAAIAFVIAAVSSRPASCWPGGSLAGGERKTTLGGGTTSQRSKDEPDAKTSRDERTAPPTATPSPRTSRPTPRPRAPRPRSRPPPRPRREPPDRTDPAGARHADDAHLTLTTSNVPD